MVTAVLGTIVGIYLAGAYSIGIFVPILFYLLGAVIGGVIGWVVGLPFKATGKVRTAGAYTGGFVLCVVGTYRATMDRLIESVYESAIIHNPSMTNAQWAPIYEFAVQQSSPVAAQKAFEVLVIVFAWIFLYYISKWIMSRQEISREDSLSRSEKQEPTLPKASASLQEERVIISCPNCTQKLRVPSGHVLRINCKSCGMHFEMKT